MLEVFDKDLFLDRYFSGNFSMTFEVFNFTDSDDTQTAKLGKIFESRSAICTRMVSLQLV